MPLLMGLLPWLYQGGPGKRGGAGASQLDSTGARNRRATVVKAAADDAFMTHPRQSPFAYQFLVEFSAA